MTASFYETQRFNQWWGHLITWSIVAFTLYFVVGQLILGHPLGNNPMPDAGVVLLTMLNGSIIWVLRAMRLDTVINQRGIEAHLYPLMKRSATWDEISEARLVSYGFVGYGLRFTPKWGMVYNIGGHKGVFIRLKSGKKYLVGTQDVPGMEAALKHFAGPTAPGAP